MDLRQLRANFRRTLGAGAIILAIAACTPKGSGGPTVATGPVRLTGTLVARADGAEIEVPDANVYLTDARGRRSAPALTGLDGSFELIAPAAGTYTLCYAIGALRECGPQLAAQARGRPLAPVAVASRPSLHGLVLTADGRPCWVADSFFDLQVSTKVSASPRGRGHSRPRSARANSEGEYALFGLGDGLYAVTARCEGASASQAARIGKGDGKADFVLPNHAPVIRTAAAYEGGKGTTQSRTGAALELRADASDSEGDTIQYVWRALPQTGQIGPANGAGTPWQMPNSPGLISAYLMARDGRGGYAYKRVDMEVEERKTIGLSGTVTSEVTGLPLGGVLVTSGDASMRTNDRGWFSLNPTPRDDDRYVINVQDGDYALMSRVFDGSARGVTLEMTPAQVTTVPAGRPVRIVDTTSAGFCGTVPGPAGYRARPVVRRVKREAADSRLGLTDALTGAYDKRPAVAAREFPCVRRGATISFGAGALEAPGGGAPRGAISAAITTLNPTRTALPGDYTAVNANREIVSLLSYGAVDARFTDAAGRPLNLRTGATAEVRIPVPPGQEASARPTLPMWWYDSVQGRWIQEEEEAVLERGPDGLTYVGKTRHFSVINIDFPAWDSNNFTNITCLKVEVDQGFNAWSNKSLTVHFNQNGNAGQVQSIPLDSSPYHAIYTIPWHTGSPPNTVRLELRGTRTDPVTTIQTVYVLLDKVIDTDALAQMDTSDGAFPQFPFDQCASIPPLVPPAALIPYYGTDASGRPAFLGGPGGSFNPEDPRTAQYYAHVDNGTPKGTLQEWWAANGFEQFTGGPNGNATYARASYTNFNDLGFGRDMHCLEPDPGRLSCYVTNYGLPDQSAGNANSAFNQLAGQRGATVAMEYDTSVTTIEPVRFYVYGGGVASSGRIDFADLDGFGPKPVPYLCAVCHGGTYKNATDDVPNARFREFDLPTFLYPDNETFDFSSSTLSQGPIGAFAKLNKMVHDAQPILPILAPNNKPTAIAALIEAWYTNPGTGAPQSPTPPDGWDTLPFPPLYHGAYAKACRTCHIARDDGEFPYPFKVFNDPDNFKFADFPFVADFVCGSQIGGGPERHRLMPNAVVTYRNFWADVNRVQEFETLTGVSAGTCGQ